MNTGNLGNSKQSGENNEIYELRVGKIIQSYGN